MFSIFSVYYTYTRLTLSRKKSKLKHNKYLILFEWNTLDILAQHDNDKSNYITTKCYIGTK